MLVDGFIRIYLNGLQFYYFGCMSIFPDICSTHTLSHTEGEREGAGRGGRRRDKYKTERVQTVNEHVNIFSVFGTS